MTTQNPSHDPEATKALMSGPQADQLRRLAFDAYEPEAFQQHLTAAEAARRIETLRAKLKLLDGPPHTL